MHHKWTIEDAPPPQLFLQSQPVEALKREMEQPDSFAVRHCVRRRTTKKMRHVSREMPGGLRLMDAEFLITNFLTSIEHLMCF